MSTWILLAPLGGLIFQASNVNFMFYWNLFLFSCSIHAKIYWNTTSSPAFVVTFVGGPRASSRYIPWYTQLQNGLGGQRAFSGRLKPPGTFSAFLKTIHSVRSWYEASEVFACVCLPARGGPLSPSRRCSSPFSCPFTTCPRLPQFHILHH